MARETGLEPATSGVTGRRSNQLSYSPASGGAKRPRSGVTFGYSTCATVSSDRARYGPDD